MIPPLVAVAHGSRDPRSAATVRALVDQVRAQAAGAEVRVAFLDLSEPLLTDVLADLHAKGHREVVVVPLLLGSAFHARVDIPALVAEVTGRFPLLRVAVSDVLGPRALLVDAVRDRLAAAGAGPDPELGVVLTGVGSSQSSANAAVARLARRWQARGDYARVAHAFATCGPDVAAAIDHLRAAGARRFAVAPWFLAPGLLLDQVAVLARETADDVVVAEPLGAYPLVAGLVLARYAETTAIRYAA